MIKKLYWMLGYNNLSIILEQERKHWLLKTDSKKQIQNALTGDIFQGMLENLGSDIAIESRKLPYKYDFISDITIDVENVDKILGINNSAFPHSAEVNGFMFTRILSTNFPHDNGTGLNFNHWRITFRDMEECILPFGASVDSDEVYADKWLKTTTAPVLELLDPEEGTYYEYGYLDFASTVTNPVWYYPLTETLQPLELTDLGNGSYRLAAINDDNYIGYPLFWFTCDQSNVGSNIIFTNNKNSNNDEYFYISNAGNATPYDANIYTGISGNNDGTPDCSSTSNYVIRCSPKEGTFNNNSMDFNVALDPESMVLLHQNTTSYSVGFNITPNDSNTKITMHQNQNWEFVDSTTYQISMAAFDGNCIYDTNTSPLNPVFDVHFDESIPFVKASTDVGIAGIKMGAANLASDVYDKYPYNLNRWRGLPEWLNEMTDDNVPEHNVLYAFHQPPGYDPENPETMQCAGLILDPGKHQTGAEPTEENIGRVYVLSNDDITYQNNNAPDLVNKKPARTAARICDIPTSVMQLLGVAGLSSGPIVDPYYVRTEASYSTDDKNKLYNTLASRWVRPTVLVEQIEHDIIHVEPAPVIDNLFAFESKEELELINMEFTDFRETINLNPMVDTSEVHLAAIVDGGSGYEAGQLVACVVGGSAFTMIVETVDDNGRILTVENNDVIPPEQESINLANFNMDPGSAGTTTTYSTSLVDDGDGRGLKIRLNIRYDYYINIKTKPGEFFTDLFAFVRERDGAYVYNYKINTNSTEFPKPGVWTKGMCISEYEVTSTDKSIGGVSTQESFINSIIPSLRTLPIVRKRNNEETVAVKVMQSASFVNILDTGFSPVLPNRDSDSIIGDDIVDMCKLHCNGLMTLRAPDKTIASVFDTLKANNVIRFDSYIIWRWVYPSNPNNKDFLYGVVSRGFNNFFTTDTSTMLPTNELNCDNYVHVNGNTTVVWNVSGVGTMLWIYDPNYTKQEEYYIDQTTMELHVHRKDMTYGDIDIRQGTGEIINVVENGVYKFNIITNNPSIASPGASSPIYQQPDIEQIINVDTAEEMVPFSKMPKGNWRLVFPRVNTFRLANDQTGTEWVPIKMQVVKGRDISNVGNVTDEDGNQVSMKTLIMSDTNNGEDILLFNAKTGVYEKI